MIDGLRSNYAPDFIEVYKKFFIRTFEKRNINAFLYKELSAFAEQAGFHTIKTRIDDKKATAAQLKQTFINGQKLYQTAINQGTLTNTTLQGWLHVIELTPDDAEIYLNGLHCLTATKE